MTNTSDKLDAVLNEIEMNCDPANGSDQCNRFRIACLSLVRSKLPPIAVEGFELANGHIEGHVSMQLITAMLSRCWQYLKENHHHDPLNHPIVSGIRAVICLLYGQTHPEERDIVDHMGFFLMLVNNVEPHFEEEESLLRVFFGKCL